jgi:glycine dehydrogenase
MSELMTNSNSETMDFSKLENHDEFIHRHIGPSPFEIEEELKFIGLKSLDELILKTVPQNILTKKPLAIGAAISEQEMLTEARALAAQNKVYKSYIGAGYYATHTPNVILRNVLENPAWYTSYTPYQAEIAQGRLEALLNFQSMVIDLTGLPIANASLLDEGTAAAEAMHLCYGDSEKKNAKSIFASQDCHPQTLAVLKTRAEALGLEVVVGDHQKFDFAEKFFTCLIQYPSSSGEVFNYADFVSNAHAQKITVIAACDILALTLLTPPGEFGVDVAVGCTQRFGVPMGFGGPHAGYLATKEALKRSIPGRIIGVSIDANNNPAMRLALQTREQHIRREKATSNICTAQVLLAVIAGMYATYHGPEGLKKIARRTHRLSCAFATGIKTLGYEIKNKFFFDTMTFEIDLTTAQKIKNLCSREQVNLRWDFGLSHGAGATSKTLFGVSFDETTTPKAVEQLWRIFAEAKLQSSSLSFAQVEKSAPEFLPSQLQRKSSFMSHPVFNTHHSETEMLRYIFKLQGKDLSLVHSMIPLGSCTMKLNATAEMIPVTWNEFANIHPFAPKDQSLGYQALIEELEKMLSDLTGFAGISLQPNAGSQGEYAGLLAIRKYHHSRNDFHRNICLIPSSAHGTNPASAVMAGMQVVIVSCDKDGNVDVNDLKTKAELHKKDLAALMVTYPSTHGVFEEAIKEICDIIHAHGGQVYMDGANFNALVGLCRPGEFGPDVCHLNLHKTFCIPHGGGGPGVGPIGVREHLIPFLPTTIASYRDHLTSTQQVSSAPFGSSSILCISWAYIKMMGGEGLKKATQTAILNANYMAKRLSNHYSILYKGQMGFVAHECILDLRPLKAIGVEAEDVAKRLMDYGFHAPTMSWPVTGTLMVEPTESESKSELDRFCEAMILIREEVRLVENGKFDKLNNPLKRAPHTQQDVIATNWDRPYSREVAAFPAAWVKENKFWPSVARVNNPHGDRNLVCSCLPVDSYQQTGV